MFTAKMTPMHLVFAMIFSNLHPQPAFGGNLHKMVGKNPGWAQFSGQLGKIRGLMGFTWACWTTKKGTSGSKNNNLLFSKSFNKGYTTPLETKPCQTLNERSCLLHPKSISGYTIRIYIKEDIMRKYYFISYVSKRLGREFFDCDVVEEHPFTWLKNVLSETNFKTVLIGWQEISEEEYEMYNKGETVANPNQIEAPQTSPLELINHNPMNDLKC